MNPGGEFYETCVCGRSFAQLNALRKHEHLCQKSRKRLSSALIKAKALWPGRKRRRVSDPETPSTSTSFQQIPDVDASMLSQQIPDNVGLNVAGEDIHLSIAERKPRRSRVLPTRFRDVLPEPSPALPPTLVDHFVNADSRNSTSSSSLPAEKSTRPLVQRIGSRLRRVFRSPRNVFGLSRQYCGHEPPSHDPEESISLSDLCSSSHSVPAKLTTTSLPTSQSFDPYPNKNSSLLGNWYWNGGAQKSQESFKELLKIVGDPDFRPADVRDTKWASINTTLGQNKFDDEEWEDEDAGWNRTSVNISAPFHQKAVNPGPKNYVVADFYHRSLVEVIREKLANPADHRQFHYEPYELHWEPSEAHEKVRVQGELYTSPAFVNAHRELQEAPGEPGCDLPRVVAALMFWSDSTHLTSFGNSNLWPLYMYFGNESKYRRCKPSCHLCCHVAYFQKVGQPAFFISVFTHSLFSASR